MSAAGIITLIGVVLTIVVLAGYLIVIALILKHVFGRLETILEAVSDTTETTQPLGGVVGEINADLASGQKALEACVERLRARREDAAAEEEEVSPRHQREINPEPRSVFAARWSRT